MMWTTTLKKVAYPSIAFGVTLVIITWVINNQAVSYLISNQDKYKDLTEKGRSVAMLGSVVLFLGVCCASMVYIIE